MRLIGVEVMIAMKLFHVAEFYELLTVNKGDVFVALSVEDEKRRHSFHLVEEFIGQTTVPFCNSIYGNSLRTCG